MLFASLQPFVSGGTLVNLFGNTTGLKPNQVRVLKSLYNRRVPADRFISAPLARTLTELSSMLSRRIGLLIDRSGNVTKVIIGDAHRVFVPELGFRRAGSARFRGVRLVLSNNRPHGLTEDDLTDLVLLQLDAIVSIHVLPSGLPGSIQFATLLPPKESGEAVHRITDVEGVHQWTEDFTAFITDLEAQFSRSPQLKEIAGREAVILVGITLNNQARAERGLTELRRLAETAGLAVVDEVLQRREKLDGRTCIGAGKLQELLIRSMHLGAEALIFDRELSPSQLRNIATLTDLKVLDRTQLILDIFAQHAQSREGKLQVELAQLRYRMPRLSIMPTAMSRLTGGIGGRGPGETKLEINKRRAQERLTSLERQLVKLAKNRAVRRANRVRNNIPIVSIVGYTNAGKSTLLNFMTHSEVVSEDKLFATLDPTTRRIHFPAHREIILTDTVGFIEDLPDTLFSAFRSTLEELEQAHLLLHIVDASDSNVEHHLAAVNKVINELGLKDRPQLKVWNKMDLTSKEQLTHLLNSFGGVAISAHTGANVSRLLSLIEEQIFEAKGQKP